MVKIGILDKYKNEYLIDLQQNKYFYFSLFSPKILAGCTFYIFHSSISMKKIYFFFFLFILLVSCHKGMDSFELQNGDLLFSVGKGDSELLTAIQNSTSKKDEIPFSHVGIVSIENEKTYVLEATTPKGVVKTKLEDFFNETSTMDNKHLIAVGRIKDEYRYTIANAIKNAKKHLGKKYDYAYDETNKAFYCSELVRFSFLDSLGNPIFEPIPMTFRDSETGYVSEYWVKHFEKLGKPIPEGQPGTNPADMTKSEVLKIVHTYY